MNTKLTLRLDADLIASAKRYSEKSGRSVSQLVSDYFALIEAGELVEATPRVRSLRGVLAGSALSEEDYLRQLEAKHR